MIVGPRMGTRKMRICRVDRSGRVACIRVFSEYMSCIRVEVEYSE